MKRTKLEEYLAIIDTLFTKGPVDLTQISNLVRIDISTLSKYLDFLTKQSAIAGFYRSDGTLCYFASPVGIKIIRYFGLDKDKTKSRNFAFT